MKLPNFSCLIFLALAAASSLSAAEITGKVRDAGGDTATVTIDGDALPAVGDSAEIFFKIQGAEEEISVASGKVAAVEAKVVRIKIDKATGTIEKDQIARIKSEGTAQTPAASPAGTTGTGVSISGDWTGTAPGGGTVSFSFKEDGTLLFVSEDSESALSTTGKYRLDPSTKPQTIELFDFEDGPMKGELLRGIFEMQSDGRLKLDFLKDAKAAPLKEFTKEALVFSKATSPIVRSNKPAPSTPAPSVAGTPSSAPQPAPHEPSPEVRKLIDKGVALKDLGDLDAAVKTLTEAIKLDPKAVDAYWWRGSCYDLQDNHAAAIRDWNEVGRLDPSQRESREKLMEELHWEEKAKKEQQSKKR